MALRGMTENHCGAITGAGTHGYKVDHMWRITHDQLDHMWRITHDQLDHSTR